MSTSSKLLTWARLFEAADRLDGEWSSTQHSKAATSLLLKCAMEKLQVQRAAGLAAAARNTPVIVSANEPVRQAGRASPAASKAGRSARAQAERPRRVFFKAWTPSPTATKNMTDAEVLALARRLARL